METHPITAQEYILFLHKAQYSTDPMTRMQMNEELLKLLQIIHHLEDCYLL